MTTMEMTQTTLDRTRRTLLPMFLALAGIILAGCGGDEAPAAVNDPAAEQVGEHADEHGDEHTEEEGVVELTEAAVGAAGIIVGEVATREIPSGPSSATTVPGQVAFDPGRVVLVSPRTAGRIEELTVVEGDQVRAGQVLARVLSPAFLTAQNDYRHAARRARLLVGTEDEGEAGALADAARRRLRLLGAGEALLDQLAGGGEALDLIPIPAPFPGSIVEAHALTGAAVEPGSPIFTLADLSVVNTVAEVPERDLATLRLGQEARIDLSAYPGQPVEGTVERIAEELDPSTRTARAIVRVANPDRLLRPGMFATVHLLAPGEGPLVTRPVIPVQAVVVDGADRWAFVEVGPRTFERRAVEVEALGEGELIVHSGLEPGERLVVQGAFTLQSELAKGEFGGHAH